MYLYKEQVIGLRKLSLYLEEIEIDIWCNWWYNEGITKLYLKYWIANWNPENIWGKSPNIMSIFENFLSLLIKKVKLTLNYRINIY